MNNLYKYLLAGLLTAGSVSCSGFLDTAPRNQLSQKTAWKTPEDAEKFLVGCYDGWESGGTILYMDCLSDFGFSFHAHEGFRSIGNGTMSPTSPGASFYGYGTIGRCNLLLKQIEEIPNMPEAQKKRIIAEAKVIRAYQYFTMNFLYGGVPIMSSLRMLMKLVCLVRLRLRCVPTSLRIWMKLSPTSRLMSRVVA